MPKLSNLLLDKIVQKKLASVAELEKLVKESKSSNEEIENLLVKKRIVDIETLTQLKGELLGVPYINLKGTSLDPAVISLIPSEVMENHQIIAFERAEGELKVGLVEPQNYRAIETIEFLAKKNRLRVKYFIISAASFEEVYSKFRTIKKEVEKVLDIASAKYTPAKEREGLSTFKELEVVKGAPISKIVDVIINHAVEGKASDIHIEPGSKESRVRYRLDGILHTSLILPIYLHSAIISRIKVLANLKLDETRIPQDGRIRLVISGKPIDFRISTLPLLDNEKVVMRVLDTSAGVLSLSDLGFNKHQVAIIERNVESSHGMFLATGPTGSGKSTTLYTVLNMLNKEGVNIITLEDPVEYYLKGVNQSQVKPEVGFTFASGLRSILRQDPDIIMVGEIRDSETAELAIHAALTGHIVLSTLHTNDATGAIPRLIDMKVEPFLLSSTLNLVIAQRLIRRLCQHCQQEVELPANLKEDVFKALAELPDEYLDEINIKDKRNIPVEKLVFYKGQGCNHCGETGYKGRSVIAEVLQATDNLKKIINEGNKIDEVMAEIKKQQMISVVQDGIIKALKGITSLEEVMRVMRE
ncbi:MAG: GspE/PulE family protein [bacterium]